MQIRHKFFLSPGKALRAFFLLWLLTTCAASALAQTAPQPTPRYVGTLANNYKARKINSISLQGTTTPQQTITCGVDAAYINKISEHFIIREGETCTASFNPLVNWMHNYVYIDKNQNGTYDNIVLGANGVPTSTSEVVAFSSYQVSNNNWRKSDGTQTSNNPVINPPSFSAPSTAGIYYMRYMTDWSCIDPYGSSGDFESHGGVAIDVMLWVVKEYRLTIVNARAGTSVSIDNATETAYTTSGTVLSTNPSLAVGDIHATDSRNLPISVNVSGTNITVTFSEYVIQKTPIASLDEITDMAGYYVLTQDCSAPSSSISGFTGTLDGGFHTISGATHALFDGLNGVTIKNIILDNVNISGGTNVGAITNTANGQTRIYNCGVLATNGSSISGSANVGSIVGLLSGNARVLNCFSYANVSGGTVGGIVGNNNGTAVNCNTILDGTGSMVFNCMFFGTVSGTNKYPVFGGNTIENVYSTSNAQTTGINTYNYFLYDGSSTFSAVNSAAGVMEQSYLNRFNLYRDILNSHRDLCAMYIYGRETISNEMRHDIALWDYAVETKATIPYLHLEKLQTNTQRTLSRSIPSTGENYAGKQVGTVSCTFNINGQSFSRSLPLTDMDVDNYDFTWGKIILPFANEFSGWTLPSSGSNDYDKIITGWEITSISGGTAGAAPTAANHYNLCDPNCTAKDLYANTNYVWAQGGNYVVPDGVTSITFTAHIVNAYYLCDLYPDEGFNNTYNTSCYIGSQRSGDTYNGKTIYHTLKDAYEKMGTFTNPADQAVVLVGNYHLNTNNNGHTDSQVWPNASGSRAYQTKAATIMSIDADNNQLPDYALVSAVTFGTGRAYCPPTRFDFVCCPGQGITSYTRNGALPDVAIMHSAGWFEVTETSFMHLTEYEVRPQNFVNDNSPCILNGGIYEKFIYGSNLGNSGNNNKFAYFKFGGNVYITDFNPGHKGGSNDPNVTYNPKPINVSGGQIDLLYMSGKNYNFTQTGDSYFFSNGGYIKLYQGANQAQLNGNITTQIHHALIDEYYGGGAVTKYAAGQITGNISNTINNSYVKFYVAGPKFGDMAPGKTVTTVANGTTFGQYYGAGYGGTSLVSNSESSASVAFNSTDRDYARPWSTFTGKRLSYNANYGTCVSFSRLYFIYAGGGVPGSMNGNENFLNEYATLSLAKTNKVSSALTNCNIETNFYGGGCQGMVDGTITSTLEGCNVVGSVFGGGYKADATPITVYSAAEPSKSVFKASMGFFTPFGIPESDTYTWVSGTDGAVDNTAKTIGTSVDMTKMGRVTGAISITVNGGTVGQNVYGGGNESPSDDAATVLIKGGAQVGQDAFGGGNIAPVGKDVSITLGVAGAADVSNVAGAIYGGGALASTNTTSGNTKVNLYGGSVTDVYGGGLGRLTSGTEGQPGYMEAVEAIVNGNTTVTLDGSVVRGNIFGCNNLNGTPKGHAFVDIKTTKPKGTETQEHPYHVLGVYGGGNLAAYEPTNVNDKTEVLIEKCENSIEDVFGGGNAAAVPETDVTVWGGQIGRVFAGGNGSSAPADVTRGTKVTIHGGTIKEVYGGSNSQGAIGGTITVDVAELKKPENSALCPINVTDLYGGGNMAPSNAGQISIGKCTNIDNVYGGANKANVTGNITLDITDGHIGNIFGGNNNSGQVNGNITVNVNWVDEGADASLGNVYGGGNLASIDNGTPREVTVNIIDATTTGSVFGAGKGKSAVLVGNTTVNIGSWTEGSVHIAGDVFGGGDLAAVEGNCTVTIRDCDTYIGKDLYGGGNAAPVFETNTTVWGGTIAGNLFGGGNGVDTSAETGNPNGAQVGYTRDDTTTGGSGNANTYLYGGTIGTWSADGKTCTAGTGGVFGGSNSNGNIHGEIRLNIDEKACDETDPATQCDMKLREIYGAGNEAAYAGEGITFNLGCVSYLGEIYGGAKAADLNSDAVLTITSGTFGKVFGGNNVSGKLNGKIVVTIEETGCHPVVIDELYGGGNLAAYSVYGYAVNGTPLTSGANPKADPQVNIISCTHIGKVFGGGLGATAVMVGNPTVSIQEVMSTTDDFAKRHYKENTQTVVLEETDELGSIGTVFGGGNEAKVIGNTTVTIATEADKGAYILGNVYGGGNQADVTGKTNVTVGH